MSYIIFLSASYLCLFMFPCRDCFFLIDPIDYGTYEYVYDPSSDTTPEDTLTYQAAATEGKQTPLNMPYLCFLRPLCIRVTML